MTHLSAEQMKTLLNQARRGDLRLYGMILLGWRHGLRATEICSLRVGDFDLTLPGFLTVQRLKGSLRTTQQLFPDEVAVLQTLTRGKTAEEFLFPGRKADTHLTRAAFYEQFQELCRSVGLPFHLSHPHVLKHSCGMTVITQGIEFTRQYLGHKSISSTGAYLRVSDEAASKAAMAAFGL